MRLAPLPMFFAADPAEAIEKSGQSSLTTHAAASCIDVCRYLGALIVGALNGAEKELLLSDHFSPVQDYWSLHPLDERIDAIASGSFKRKNPPATWLPPNSETIAVMNGPFLVPDKGPDEDCSNISECLMRSILVPYGNCLPPEIYTVFRKKTVLLAVESSKDFEFPHDVAANAYKGIHICIFRESVRENLSEQLQKNSWKLENDIWKNSSFENMFFAFIGSETVLMATNEELLQQCIDRIKQRSSVEMLSAHRTEAPGPPLPEWRLLSKKNRFWAIRHYQAPTRDRASPKYASGKMQDQEAIGVIFQYDPKYQRSAKIIYLSTSSNPAAYLKALFSSSKLKLKNIASGVEAHVPIPQSGANWMNVMLNVDALLGHAVNP